MTCNRRQDEIYISCNRARSGVRPLVAGNLQLKKCDLI